VRHVSFHVMGARLAEHGFEVHHSSLGGAKVVHSHLLHELVGDVGVLKPTHVQKSYFGAPTLQAQTPKLIMKDPDAFQNEQGG